jgi:transcriptional regulator with XRE-family HTH domain
MNNIKINTRALINYHQWTEAALADAAGISQSTVHRILNGHVVDPRRSIIEKLAMAFGVTIDDIYGINEHPLAPSTNFQTLAISDLQHQTSPRSAKAIDYITTSLLAGKLSEKDLLMLEGMARHLTNQSENPP